jgi:hypothetical protein
MSTTTPEPYPIWYPQATDPIAPLHNAFATLADSVYDAFVDKVTPLINGLETKNYSVDTITEMNALTSVVPGSRVYVVTTKSIYTYDGTAWVPSYVPWTSYTPTAITGLTFNTARYTISNNMVTVNIRVTKNTTASTFTRLDFSLPLTSGSVLDASFPLGQGTMRKGTAGFYPLVVHHKGTTEVTARWLGSSPLFAANIDGRPTVTNKPAKLETGNEYMVNFTYSL